MSEAYQVDIYDSSQDPGQGTTEIAPILNVMNYVETDDPSVLSVLTDNANNPRVLFNMVYDPSSGIFKLPSGETLPPDNTIGVVTILYNNKTVILNCKVTIQVDEGRPFASQIFRQDFVQVKPGDTTEVKLNKGYYWDLSGVVPDPTWLFNWPLTGPSDQIINSITGIGVNNWGVIVGGGASDPFSQFFNVQFSPPLGTPSGFYFFGIKGFNIYFESTTQGYIVQVIGAPAIVFPGDIVLTINNSTSVTATWNKTAASNLSDSSIPIDYVASLDGQTKGAGTMKRINDDYSFTYIDLVPGQAYTCDVVASDYTTAEHVTKSSNTVVPV